MQGKTLLLGTTGQLGQAVQRAFSQAGKELVKELVTVGRDRCDFTQPDQIRQLVRNLQPQSIINCAAYTAVDRAESEPQLATTINATAPQILAEEAEQVGATLVHFSTDYVFDGHHHLPYTETDPPNPLGQYGKSKREGEQAILATCSQSLILRTSWVYGAYGHGNFVKTMLRLGKEREKLRVVEDQIGTPTWTGDLAALVTQLPPDFTGLYHYSNSGVASWYDFAVAIFAEARNLGLSFPLQQIIPIPTSEYPTAAQRPAYSVLSSQSLIQALDHIPPHWRSSLQKMLKNYFS
ncbi:dTDP-4-dehydrorhamnose reductase [Spirulina sp. CS-785/01]|uniref:dTDP-4-dehydrorhamnose reductase n=1 Tax=Spirulina sp. CS-785/01 TaxID=3021716 RepID=UPI00232D6F17|nr:dTDP-4-dehydrorhamnose reductase [Spirulina sp. CS-785/01]MDB9312643.1 dTDP-4-dehydrorhamnose reductase [Spirulina sp. CS-785/01]